MTTQHEYKNYENMYNLISHEDKEKEFKVMTYKYINNNNVSETSFEDTKAYYNIKTTEEKVLLIDNGDLDKNLDNSKKINDNNKYFMLINIDGLINSRRFKIIPFKEVPDIKDETINEAGIKTIGGQIIKDTFYIINTYVGDIAKNFQNIKLLINKYINLIIDINNITRNNKKDKKNNLINKKNKLINKIKYYLIYFDIDKYKNETLDTLITDIKFYYFNKYIYHKIINPLNNEKYGLIQQIIFIMAEKIVNNIMKNKDDTEKIKALKDYDEYVYSILFILIDFITNKFLSENQSDKIFEYFNDKNEINKNYYGKMINDFKQIISELLLQCYEKIGSKILIYNSLINNQIGRSRNNGLLITYSLLINKCINEEYIKVLDSSGYLSYYSIILSEGIEKNKDKSIDKKQFKKILEIYKSDKEYNKKFISVINNDDDKYDTEKVISFNSIKNITKEKIMKKSDNTNIMSALYNSYNLHLYGINFFIKNIKNILCFDADLSEDSGNGRLVYKDNVNNYHDKNNYLTIYGTMNPHYMPPVIQIFNKNGNYILGVLEDKERDLWVDITLYDNIIKEIFHKQFIIINIRMKKDDKNYDDLYIYYKKIHFSYYNNIIDKLFHIEKNSNGARLTDQIFKLENNHIKLNEKLIELDNNYKDYIVNIYLGFNMFIKTENKYYSYLYNITNYNFNYMLKETPENYDNIDNFVDTPNAITFSNYVNKRISNVSGYYLLYNNTNDMGKKIIEKFEKIVEDDYNNDCNTYKVKNKYVLLKNENEKDLTINYYIIAEENNYTDVNHKNSIDNLINILTIEPLSKEYIPTNKTDVKINTEKRKIFINVNKNNKKNDYKGYIFTKGYFNGYSDGYGEGYHDENDKSIPAYTKELELDKEYNDGYNYGKNEGMEQGMKDKNTGKKYNKWAKKSKEEVYKIYDDYYLDNIYE